MRTYEFRLHPNKSQRERLMACLIETRRIYNAMLERTKQQYQVDKTFLFKADLCALFKGSGADTVPSTTVQCLADRLDKALRAFLVRKKIDPNAGFPRFKTPNRWHSIQLRQFEGDFRIESRHLIVPGKLGRAIKIKRHREIEGLPKTCHLVLRADGHWYALIVCDTTGVHEVIQFPEPGSAIGLDIGLKSFLADSDGRTVDNPRFYRKSQAALRRKQRVLSRRTKGSKRRKKAVRVVAKHHLKIDRQRRDFHFKVARQYAEMYETIVVEDLDVSRMVHGHLAKSIHDAGWNAFLTILTYKAESAGGQVVRVNPRYTTQNCSQCGAYVQKSLSVRTHRCPNCGYVADRDVNAAQNILRAGAPPSGR